MMTSLLRRGLAVGAILLFLAWTWAADTKPGMPPQGPLSPREELATFKVPKGFKVELVASEPDVVDPVAIAFDEDGRLFVAEMRGYPNGGRGIGQIASGKIKLLTDRGEDGVYRKSTTYAEGLRFPTSMMPWKGGLIVAVAPDVIYFEDTKNTGKADRQRTLYTGFDLENIQQLVNSLQWGLDNWVYGLAGSKGGDITSPEKKDAPAVTLRGRGIRFHPDQPGSLEPMSGGGQFGLSADDGQHWFTATNSQHLRQIVLPDHYLRRNPYLPVSGVVFDIPDGVDGHGAVCKVHRVSPFEAWRVERTGLRKDDPNSKRFPETELVPGGFITSACSPVIYTADLFPPAYRGNSFVCEPANNLVHRDILVRKGSIFSAQRADADCEFLASTDNWFRPVNLTIGPDGALYVVDFYREVIETPLSLPEDIKKKLNLESRGRGRIWRIVPEGAKPTPQPALSKATVDALVAHLENPNPWWRLTAQRLLVERQDQKAVPTLEKLARESKSDVGHVHALWTLQGLKALDDKHIEAALADASALVREQALRLAEGRLTASTALRAAIVKLADDPSLHVRFQLAFTLGDAEAPELAAALAKLVRKQNADSWLQMAVLSSSTKSAAALLEELARDREFTKNLTAAQLQLLNRLGAIAGARAVDADLARALNLLGGDAPASWQVAVLEGLGQGLQNSGRSLRKLWEDPPAALKEPVEKAQPFFKRAATAAVDEKRPVAERIAAARLLGYGPFPVGSGALKDLLVSTTPGELQLAAVRALAAQDNPKVADLLLAQWTGYGPAIRREVLEALFARVERLKLLLDAIEQKKVLAAQIESARLDLLRKHPNAELRARALKLLAGQVAADRQKVIEDYKSALDLKGDTAKGKMLFKKVCSTCHRLENEGVEVGPDLLAALRNKSRDALLIDILDPSREVDPRYINYVVTTKEGRILTGMIAVEAPSSITLRRAEKAEDVILRTQIEEIQATSKSVMPEDLEKQLMKQDVADVIAYLQSVAAPKK
ncbi:MAG: c-type cytochrome [Gemmataceae bacterium]|nr:c-type cytochrome [Gemmataceae bacterium]